MRAPQQSPEIVLTRLPALYGHGLHDALTTSGLGPVAIGDDVQDVVSRSGPVLVVVPVEDVDDLRSLLERADRSREVSFVVVTAEATAESFAAALRGGASGVLHATADLDLAVEIVRSAAAGRIVVPEHVTAVLSRHAPVAAPPALEPRERQWLRLLGQGETVASLARSAAYSEREVYRLLSRTYHRLGAANRTEALLRAERFGLLDD